MGRQPRLCDPRRGNMTIAGETRAAVMPVIGWMEKHTIGSADAGHIPAYPIFQRRVTEVVKISAGVTGQRRVLAHGSAADCKCVRGTSNSTGSGTLVMKPTL